MQKIPDFLVIFAGSLLFAFLLSLMFPKQSSQIIISPLVDPLSQVGRLIKVLQGKTLAQVVEESFKGTHGTYGIVIKNLRTGESYTQNEKRNFEAASLYKLWVLGTAYKQMAEGKLSKDEVITQEVRKLNEMFDIASDSAELTSGTITMRAQDAINQMITISHNYAALLLSAKLRNANISSFMRQQGFSHSTLGQPPQTTAADIALFYEKLYQGTMVDGASSRKMLEILSSQELNDRISKYLPEGIEVAHKTGELQGFKHDAGIIFGSDPILIVVLSESNSPLGAAERIAQLSKNIFDYFENH